jgi:hypothetical protein
MAPTRRRDRSSIRSAWPCGQNFSLSPIATNGMTRATRREAGVTGFDCGASGVVLWRYPTGLVVASRLADRSEAPAPLTPRGRQQRDGKAWRA